MFGISFIELLVILTVGVIIIGPKDIPEVARQLTKLVLKAKKFIEAGKKELAQAGKDLGLEEVRAEVEKELIEEGLRPAEEELTSIIDIYGNEHQVSNVTQLRTDLKAEELAEEISKHNKTNQKSNAASGE